ncbi:hypothetical protein QUW63_13900 [Pseudoflavonifractor phocaeensis]|uniref:hypothetical protein n=1 Tax=Pseudoflavonifractor phocaeensis TaxID=1870988 RepID=UPI0025A33EC6|nr:hypothetical protein [Pseudoflavonifractor phocaeensis]MDM8240184.1 hypothetical protein [Pseudoflavonifractor phocaeensis]
MLITILGICIIAVLIYLNRGKNSADSKKEEEVINNKTDTKEWFRSKFPKDIPGDHGILKFVSGFLEGVDTSFNIGSYKDGVVYGYFSHSKKLDIIGYYSCSKNNSGPTVCTVFNQEKIEIAHIHNDGYIYLTRLGFYNYFKELDKQLEDKLAKTTPTGVEHNSSLSKKEGSFAISNDKILPPKYVDKYANKYVDKFDVSSAIGCAPKYVDKYHRPIRFPSPCEKELGRLFQNHIRDAETHEIICEFDGERFGAAAACVCLSVECHTLSKYSNFVSSWEY